MKLCECGCGQPAPIATETSNGWKKGDAKRFVRNHHRRGVRFTEAHRKRIGDAKRGVPKSAEHVAKMSDNMRGRYQGPAHPNWRGDSAGYGAIHAYLARNHPKSGVCEECGSSGQTDYALIHGREYSRERGDYRELCRGCHRRYDGAGHPAPLHVPAAQLVLPETLPGVRQVNIYDALEEAA